MMGKRSGQEQLFSYNINLERRVPQDHPLRQIKSRVDFSFVRQAVADTYGHNGHLSEDPEVILKLMFIPFFDNVASERELMRQLPYRLDYLWFIGLGLDDQIPDHSVLSKSRRRWGREVFEELFVRSVRQCVDAGLVDGAKLHFDVSLIDANASNDSVIKGPPELISRLRAAFRREEDKLDRAESPDDSDDGPEGGAGDGGGRFSYEKKNDGLVSPTDPDATVVSKRGVMPALRYKNHRAVDDAHGVITALETTSGDVEENSRLMSLIDQSEGVTGVAVRTAVADSQYGTVENFRECGKRGIKSHMADLAASHKNRGRKRGIFDESAFVYDSARDVYVCPAGREMTRRRHKIKKQAYEYALGGKVCNGCELKAQCTRSNYGRSVKRHQDHELIEAARAQSASGAARRDRWRRKHLAEGSFADGANNHGFKRSRWRRLWRQGIQDFLIAACQNFRLLMARGAVGPSSKAESARPFPPDLPSQSVMSRSIGEIIDLGLRFGKIWRWRLGTLPNLPPALLSVELNDNGLFWATGP